MRWDVIPEGRYMRIDIIYENSGFAGFLLSIHWLLDRDSPMRNYNLIVICSINFLEGYLKRTNLLYFQKMPYFHQFIWL